jgi:hypothetical protein
MEGGGKRKRQVGGNGIKSVAAELAPPGNAQDRER